MQCHPLLASELSASPATTTRLTIPLGSTPWIADMSSPARKLPQPLVLLICKDLSILRLPRPSLQLGPLCLVATFPSQTGRTARTTSIVEKPDPRYAYPPNFRTLSPTPLSTHVVISQPIQPSVEQLKSAAGMMLGRLRSWGTSSPSPPISGSASTPLSGKSDAITCPRSPPWQDLAGPGLLARQDAGKPFQLTNNTLDSTPSHEPTGGADIKGSLSSLWTTSTDSTSSSEDRSNIGRTLTRSSGKARDLRRRSDPPGSSSPLNTRLKRSGRTKRRAKPSCDVL